ncbi:MAG: hypothetical protein FWD53_01350 [Phycisphaerales bacterium]|nr:hypothetical protein [Phycisphaerales bacterium]
MSDPSSLPPSHEPGDALARRPIADPVTLPVIPTKAPRRYIDAPVGVSSEKKTKSKEAGVLRGLKDLQQLQKQTIAVLETVQGSLEDIHQVLRSPEATRGIEKQKNAATLLTKGFAHEAIEQATGAVELLPANPDAHLLLALSLAADQQFEPALATARKGLALIDRRHHPLAIEAGLLHAIASLGSAAEAVERWTTIIDSLPLPVLLEQLPLITACFPSHAAKLDPLLATRITRSRLHSRNSGGGKLETGGGRKSILDTKPAQIPPSALLAGIDAAFQAQLSLTHRAILVLVVQRLNAQRDLADVLRFITECIVPLGERKLKSASTLARTCVKRLHRYHADAPTLHRAMTKLQLAGTHTATRRIATLLTHWRTVTLQVTRARRTFTAATTLLLAGITLATYILLAPHPQYLQLPTLGPVTPLHLSLALIAIGTLLGFWCLLGNPIPIQLPNARPPLTKSELRFLRSATLRQALRSVPRSRSTSI